MAIVVVSLDTESRQAVLTINGALIPSDEFSINKYLKYDTEGEYEIGFGYTVEHTENGGLTERRYFYLPSSEEAGAELNDDGFASKAVHDDEKAKADTIKFLKRDRNS